MLSRISLLLCLAQLLLVSLAFSQPLATPTSRTFKARHRVLTLRGGQEENISPRQHTNEPAARKQMSLQIPMVTTALVSLGNFYVRSLESSPIFTKSVTAGCIFAVSDWLAQKIDRSSDELNKKRMIASSLVGFLYFGPAAHFWYENIFRLFPGTTLVSTLQKAAMGQLIFGPSFTCIFFATALMQSGSFTLTNWYRKCKSDLFGAWLAGVGFWPLVDLVSYSLVPRRWIPLFINICSLIWNVYLSFVANRRTKTATL